MALFDWKDSYSVAVPKYDAQHKKLIELVNKLHQSMSEGKGREVLEGILTELIKYTKTHFADEENELKRLSYPDFVNHKREHDKLTADVMKFYDDFKAGKGSVTVEILNFLKNWLMNHIMGTDKKYGQFLTSKGVK
jgi:hemerythrin